MTVLMSDIKLDRKGSSKGTIKLEASLGLNIIKEFKTPSAELMAQLEHSLKMAVIAYIYGDLIEPINELAQLAGNHIVGNQDRVELQRLRELIGSILIGAKPADPNELAVPS